MVERYLGMVEAAGSTPAESIERSISRWTSGSRTRVRISAESIEKQSFEMDEEVATKTKLGALSSAVRAQRSQR